MARQLNTAVDNFLSDRKLVKAEFLYLFELKKHDFTAVVWPFFSFVQRFFANFVSSLHGGAHDFSVDIAANVILEIQSFSVRCYTCQGWGHSAIDNIPTRLKKGDKPEGLKSKKDKKQIIIKTGNFYQKESY